MFRVLLLASVVLFATGATAAPKAAGLEVRQAWSRPATAGSTGVGYGTLANPGGKAAVLVRVESPLAAKGEMHASSISGGVMRMAAEARVDVPAHGQVVFAPGGRHLMFVGLKRALKPGNKLPATLIFADGRKLKVTFAVGNGLGPP